MPFFLLRKYRFLKNKRLTMFFANELIDNYEKDIQTPSCKSILLESISKQIDYYQSSFATYTNENDLLLAAKSMVSMTAFDLATSGEYHLLGHFNYRTAGGSLVHVHRLAVKDALADGLITQEEYDEDLLALKEALQEHL